MTDSNKPKNDNTLKSKIGTLTRKLSKRAVSGISNLVRQSSVRKTEVRGQSKHNSQQQGANSGMHGHQYGVNNNLGGVRRSSSFAEMAGSDQDGVIPRMPGGRMRGYSIRVIPQSLTDKDD